MKNSDSSNYDDIIHLARPVSKRHPQMPLKNRAAQFAPFAALSGHKASVREAERLTDPFPELDEDKKEMLDQKIRRIKENLAQEPEIEFSYFTPDEKKDGGTCTAIRGKVKKIDEYGKKIIFTDGTALSTERICSVKGELFRDMDESDV